MNTLPFSEMYGTRTNKKALILLPGPSLKPYTRYVERILRNKTHEVWMCNNWETLRDFLGVLFSPSFLFFIDSNWFSKSKKLELFLPNDTTLVIRNETDLERKNYFWFGEDRQSPSGIFTSWFTGDLMLQGAVFAGYKEICVFGWSCSALVDKRKTHSYAYKGSGNHQYANLIRVRKAMESFFRSLSTAQCESLCIFEGSNHPFYSEIPWCFYGD